MEPRGPVLREGLVEPLRPVVVVVGRGGGRGRCRRGRRGRGLGGEEQQPLLEAEKGGEVLCDAAVKPVAVEEGGRGGLAPFSSSASVRVPQVRVPLPVGELVDRQVGRGAEGAPRHQEDRAGEDRRLDDAEQELAPRPRGSRGERGRERRRGAPFPSRRRCSSSSSSPRGRKRDLRRDARQAQHQKLPRRRHLQEEQEPRERPGPDAVGDDGAVVVEEQRAAVAGPAVLGAQGAQGRAGGAGARVVVWRGSGGSGRLLVASATEEKEASTRLPGPEGGRSRLEKPFTEIRRKVVSGVPLKQ